MSEQKKQAQQPEQQEDSGTFEDFRSTPEQDGSKKESAPVDEQSSDEGDSQQDGSEAEQEGSDYRNQSLSSQSVGSRDGSGGIVGNV